MAPSLNGIYIQMWKEGHKNVHKIRQEEWVLSVWEEVGDKIPLPGDNRWWRRLLEGWLWFQWERQRKGQSRQLGPHIHRGGTWQACLGDKRWEDPGPSEGQSLAERSRKPGSKAARGQVDEGLKVQANKSELWMMKQHWRFSKTGLDGHSRGLER